MKYTKTFSNFGTKMIEVNVPKKFVNNKNFQEFCVISILVVVPSITMEIGSLQVQM